MSEQTKKRKRGPRGHVLYCRVGPDILGKLDAARGELSRARLVERLLAAALEAQAPAGDQAQAHEDARALAPEAPEAEPSAQAPPVAASTLADQVLETVRGRLATNGGALVPVRVVREVFSDVPREDLDAALIALVEGGKLGWLFWPPDKLDPSDRAAGLEAEDGSIAAAVRLVEASASTALAPGR